MADRPADSALASATPFPAASVIVSSRNRQKLLTDAVQSVLEGDRVPAEIVIIDQSDREDLVLAGLRSDRGCEIRYRWHQSVGVSRGRNEGIAAAKHDCLVFIDDDLRVSRSWLGTLVGALERFGSCAVVTGRVETLAEQPGGFQLATKVEDNPALFRGRVGKDVLFSGNMAMFRSAICHIGDFDEALGPGTPFPGGEDNDLGYRLLEAGYSIAYVPEAVVYHREWRSKRDYLPMRWKYGLGRGGFYAKHTNLRDGYMLRRMLRDVRSHVLACRAEVIGNRRRGLGHLTLAAGILVGFGRWGLQLGVNSSAK